MRECFRACYTPSDTEFAQMWQQTVFAFDANMLLHVYEYGEKTRQAFFTILAKLGGDPA